MANTNKITKMEVINSMLSNEMVKENPTWVAYLENEKNLLVKKAEKARSKNSDKATENTKLAEKVLAVMEEIGKGCTATEIANASDDFKSNQQVSYLLRILIADGKVSKETVKGKSIFSLV